MHSSRSSTFLTRALQLAGLATALFSAVAPLYADESGVAEGIAMLTTANMAGSLLRSLAGTRAVRPAPERAPATPLVESYDVAPGLALEGPRVSFATSMPPSDTLVGDAAGRAAVWSVSSVGWVPLDSSLSLFARFGLHYADGPGQISSPAQVDDLGQVYGVGFRFAPTDRIDLHAEMQRFTGAGSDGSADGSVMLFGARVRF
jgi:hypothetical protein